MNYSTLKSNYGETIFKNSNDIDDFIRFADDFNLKLNKRKNR